MTDNYNLAIQSLCKSCLQDLEKEKKKKIKSKGYIASYLEENITLKLLQNAHIFKLTQKVTNVIYNPDCNFNFLHIPFPNIFLDTKIRIENSTINGILIIDLFQEGLDKYHYGQNHQHCLKLLKQLPKAWVNLSGKKVLKIYFNIVEDKIKNKSCWMEMTTDMNDIKHRPEWNTFSNVNEFNKYCSNEYIRRTHSWIVRGFYRTLKSDKYINKIGQSIFIAPYIKGIGKLKEKSRFLKGKEETVWINQHRLLEIIKDIYSEHLVLNNTRGFLDGFEIDVYIPDLKLGFEYNGKQHYEFVNKFHHDESDLDKQFNRDESKNRIAKEKGITLITIKYDEPLTEEYILNKIGDIKK